MPRPPRYLLTITILWATVLFLTAIAPRHVYGEYDPIAEIQAKLAKAQEEKQKTDDAIQALKPKLQELENAKTALQDTKDRLEQLRQKMRAIRAWNLFVTVMGGTMDVIQKVNPGSSVVIAAANFIQDRVQDKLKDTDKKNQITMRVKRMSELAASLSPKVRMVERNLQLTPQQVADQLVAMGRVDNDWVQGWNRTPDVVAQSDAVVVAKIEFVLEALGPAIEEVTSLIAEIEALLADLYAELGALESDAKRLTEEVHDWERQLELQGVLKESMKPPQAPAPVTVDVYNGPSKDYGTAAGEMTTAWNDLKACKIDGGGYWALRQAAYYAANRKQWEILKPYSDTVNTASQAFWACRDAPCHDATMPRYQAAIAAYSAATAREQAAYKSAVLDTMKALDQEAQRERERYDAFFARLKNWQSIKIQIPYTVYSLEKMNYEYTVENGAYTGQWLAMGAWAGSQTFRNMVDGTRATWVSSLYDIRKQYEDFNKAVQDMKNKMREALADMKAADNAASGIASQAPSLADELKPNIEVWQYVGGTYWWGDLRELHRRLAFYQPEFNAAAKVSRAQADELMQDMEENATRAAAAASAVSAVGTVLDSAAKSLDAKKRLLAASRTNLDPGGTSMRTFLKGVGMGTENIKILQDLLQKLTTPEQIEAHVLTLLPDQPEYDRNWRPIPTKDLIDTYRQNYRKVAAQIQTNRDAYSQAFKEYQTADSALGAGLKSLKTAFLAIYPQQIGIFDKTALLSETSRRTSNEGSSDSYLLSYFLQDPADFADFTYGLQEIIDQYVQLAERYHQIVDPVLAKVKAEGRGEARKLMELKSKVTSSYGSLMGADQATFSSTINGFSNEASALIDPLQRQGYAQQGSAVAKAYGEVLSAIMWVSSDYYARQRIRDAITDIDSHMNGARSFLQNPDTFGGNEGAAGWATTLENDAKGFASFNNAEINSRLAAIPGLVSQLRQYLGRDGAAMKQKVQALYDGFKAAYEEKNDSLVVACLADTWQAEGTTISDFQKNIRTIFRVFDEVRYVISNLQINKTGEKTFTTSYDVTITSRIYKRNLKHEEKSSVSEEVVIDPSGKARISRTLGGKFWYVQ